MKVSYNNYQQTSPAFKATMFADSNARKILYQKMAKQCAMVFPETSMSGDMSYRFMQSETERLTSGTLGEFMIKEDVEFPGQNLLNVSYKHPNGTVVRQSPEQLQLFAFELLPEPENGVFSYKQPVKKMIGQVIDGIKANPTLAEVSEQLSKFLAT